MQALGGSSHIESTGYDPQAQVLRVKFKSGGVYDYHGVPQFMATDIRVSESPGGYLAKIVKPGCPASKV